MRPEQAVQLLVEEYGRATKKFKPFNSAHEGYAVMLEEMDELKTEVWKRPAKRDPAQMRNEAAQVGAMALRFLIDLCEVTEGSDELRLSLLP